MVSAQTMEFESQLIDYGIIEHNSNGKREFKFTNTGDKSLIIKSVKGSCGCTVPSYKKEDGSTEWSSGETGVIKVIYATNRIGDFIKNIIVTTNIPGNKPIILTIKGKVIKNK
jgi:hypothetical protein